MLSLSHGEVRLFVVRPSSRLRSRRGPLDVLRQPTPGREAWVKLGPEHTQNPPESPLLVFVTSGLCPRRCAAVAHLGRHPPSPGVAPHAVRAQEPGRRGTAPSWVKIVSGRCHDLPNGGVHALARDVRRGPRRRGAVRQMGSPAPLPTENGPRPRVFRQHHRSGVEGVVSSRRAAREAVLCGGTSSLASSRTR
jgi:hypothetical protein